MGVNEDELAEQFLETYDAEDIDLCRVFARFALNIAHAMHAHAEDNFDWIRSTPAGGLAYCTAMWHFAAKYSEYKTGEAYVLADEEDPQNLDAVGELTQAFSQITFGAYNKMTGGENVIAELEEEPDDFELAMIEERTDYFYKSFLVPELIRLQAN